MFPRICSEIFAPGPRWCSTGMFYLMLLAAQLALIWPQRAAIHEDIRRLTGPRPRDSGPSFHGFGLDRASSNGAEPCLEALVPGLGDGDGLKQSPAGISTLPVLLLAFTRASAFSCDHPGEPGQLHLRNNKKEAPAFRYQSSPSALEVLSGSQRPSRGVT